MKLQIDVFNWNHTLIKSIYVIFDDVPKLLDYLEELTRNTDDTYLIHNGDNSRAAVLRSAKMINIISYTLKDNPLYSALFVWSCPII